MKKRYSNDHFIGTLLHLRSLMTGYPSIGFTKASQKTGRFAGVPAGTIRHWCDFYGIRRIGGVMHWEAINPWLQPQWQYRAAPCRNHGAQLLYV